MRRGVFEEYEAEDGGRIYRLRWVEEVTLSQEEMARGNFMRYLISKGRLGEECDHRRPR